MTATTGLVITGGVLAGRPVDLHLAGDRIDAVTAPGERLRAGERIDVGGAVLMPGLHDHHVHLRAWAAAAASVAAGPPETPDREALARALACAPGGPGSWIRAVGYHDSVAGRLDRHALDALAPQRPVRLQHRSGALWILNSMALEAVGLGAPPVTDPPPGAERDATGRPTGRLWREDAWLADRLPRQKLGQDDALRALSQAAAARGVTGFTDATPDRDDAELAALASAAARGIIAQRLHLMAPLGATLERETSGGSVDLGPVKVILDDDRLPAIDELSSTIRTAHGAGRAVAVHCVTRVQAVVALAAWEAAGSRAGDRLEHGAVLAAEHFQPLRRLGITVVTQPGFVAARGDQYLTEVDPIDRPDLWRLRSLLDAGVQLAASSDAPLGPSDPWQAVRAGVDRRTASGEALGPAEALDWTRSLGLWTGHAARPAQLRRLATGEPADICALRAPVDSREPEIVITVSHGAVIYQPSPDQPPRGRSS